VSVCEALLEQIAINRCAAAAPCPAAIIIWQFAGVTHPAAYSPGTLVRMHRSTLICPSASSFARSFFARLVWKISPRW